MDNLQNKVLRLHNGPNIGTDWQARSTGYSKNEIASIQDPAIGFRKETIAIPSPFARLHLFENAFRRVADQAKLQGGRTLSNKTNYHLLVSDALDVAEAFFCFEIFNQTQKNMRFVVWNKRKELENLKTRPEHRLFGETLELFMKQDAGKTRFDLVDNVYLLYCDDVLLGGTSPSTLFFAAHNEGFRLAKLRLNRGDDWLFDAEPYPLFMRSMQFQRYLYGLFILAPSLREIMSPLWHYLEVSHAVLKAERPADGMIIQAILDRRDFDPGTFFHEEFVAATTGESDAFIEVMRGTHHRRMNSSSLDYSHDDFAILSDKYRLGRRPLVLQNNFNKALSYSGGVWRPDIAVPFQDTQQELNKRVLPGTTEVYPYLTVSDFLEPNIIQVTYPLDEEYFFNGNLEGFRKSDRSIGDKGVPGEDAFLLPLTRRFFEFFDPEFLSSFTPDGRPRFRIINKVRGSSVEVELLVPIQSGDFIRFRRVYHRNQTPDLTKNEGSIVPCRFDLGLFPPFYIKDGQEEIVKQIVVLADGDTLPMTKLYEYNLDFYQCEGKVVAPLAKRTRQDKHKHQSFVTTKYFSLDKKYDYIQVSNGEHLGIIIPKWREKSAGNKTVTVAVDFGATNSFVGFIFGDEPPCALEITKKERFLVTLSEHWVNTNPLMMKEAILRTLAPYTLGKSQECSLPIRNVIAEIQGINYDQAIPGMDISIPFFFGSRSLLKNEEWSTNLKWGKISDSEGVMNNRRVEAYLSILLFMARNFIITHGGDLNNCKLVWLYSSSIGEMKKALFGKYWARIANEYLGANTEVISLPEAVAPYYYFSYNQPLSGKYPVLNVNISDNTTDVIIFRDSKPVYSTSFLFAGNAIFGNGYANPQGRDNGLIRLFRKTVDNWFEANKGVLYNLQDAYIGENRSVIHMGSADINSFYFSLETNKEVRDNHVRPLSYAELISEREDVKVALLVFFSAIIYHLAHLMKLLGQPMPRYITFSGENARIISLFDNDKRSNNAAGLASLIFKKVYGKEEYRPEGLEILVGSNPEEQMTFGALNMVRRNDLDLSFKNTVLLLIGTSSHIDSDATLSVEDFKPFLTIDNIRQQDEGKDMYVQYKNLTESHYDQVEQEVQSFLDFFFDLDKEFSFSRKFGALTGDQLLRCKNVLTTDLRSNLRNGLDARLSTTDMSDNVSEPLFFYPLIGSIQQLLDHFADEAKAG